MKIIQSVIVGKIFLILAALFSLVGSINAMKPHLRQGYSGQATSSLIKTSKGRQLGLENVWVQTSDSDKAISVPLWQIEQMTELYKKFVEQDGHNSAQNPVDASLITTGELKLLQEAFEKVEKGLFKYERGDVGQLVAVAGKVGAQSLSALLAKSILPKDVQPSMVSEIIEEVVSYIKDPQNAIINLVGHNNMVTCVAFNPGGTFFVSGSTGENNNLIMWDAATLQQKSILNGHTKTVTCVAVSPDSQYIVSGAQQGNNDNLILWNVGTQKFKKLSSKWFLSSIGHSGNVNCVAFSPDGNFIVSGSSGGTNNLIVWDVHAKKQKYALVGHTNDVTCVAFSPDGNYIASGSADNTVILWDNKTGKLLHIFEGHSGMVLCLAFDYDSTKIISGAAGTEKTLFIWDIETKEAQGFKLPRGTGSINTIVFSPDKRYFCIGGGGYLAVWDAQTEKMVHSYPFPGVIKALDISYDSSCFAAGRFSGKQNIVIGDGKTQNINSFSVSQHIMCLAFNSHDSNILIIGSQGASEGEYAGDYLNCLKIYDSKVLVDIEKKLTISQAYFLYRLYKAQINNDTVIIDERDQDYAAYETLPFNIKQLLKTFFPFQVVETVFPFKQTSKTFEQAVQEKKKTYKPLFVGLTTNEKIAKIKQIMGLIPDKNSVDYKACQELLNEFDMETAFEV